MKISCTSVIIACLILLIVATSANAWQNTARGLGGTTWRLIKFQGSDDTTATVDDRAKYTLDFAANGSMTVRIDCNRGRGTWKSTGPGQVEFGPLALTRAVCARGSLHDRIVKHWPLVRSYVIRNGHLFLALMADGGIYEWEPVAGPPPPATPLEKTYWKATQIGGKPVVEANPARAPHLVFEQGNRVQGSDGCNRVAGRYELTGDAMSFKEVAGTQMACLGTGESERAFRDALGKASRWRIAGDGLELFDSAGSRLVLFQAIAPPPQ
jgi:heat shock protein HslJ